MSEPIYVTCDQYGSGGVYYAGTDEATAYRLALEEQTRYSDRSITVEVWVNGELDDTSENRHE